MLDQAISTMLWSDSHGAKDNHFGMGMVYFALAYALKATKCVCLGSGAGFVPVLMYSAQEKLLQEGLIEFIDVSLVDADAGIWGKPIYKDQIENYEGIKVIKKLTDECFDLFENISYLHVDADHSYEQVYKDLKNYGNRMRKSNWAITVHDTFHRTAKKQGFDIGSYQAAKQWAEENNLGFVNFEVGCGTALILPKEGI